MKQSPLFSACALALVLGTFLLTGCRAHPAASAQRPPSPTSSTQVNASPGASLTATPRLVGTPTIMVHGDWQTYIDGKYGFHLDVPAILTLAFPQKVISDPDSSLVAWSYDSLMRGQPAADQAIFSEIEVVIYATDTRPVGFPSNACTQGTPITIGSGVTAYEDDSLDAPPSSGGARGEGGLDVNLATGGVFLHITLYGSSPKETFRARYGTIWQHILNSFVPGPPVPPDPHLCL